MKKIIIVIIVIAGLVLGVWLKFGYVRTFRSDFTGPVSVDNSLPEELIDQMEDYVQKIMKANETPGVAMVL